MTERGNRNSSRPGLETAPTGIGAGQRSQAVARALEDWPLLAMLAEGRSVTAPAHAARSWAEPRPEPRKARYRPAATGLGEAEASFAESDSSQNQAPPTTIAAEAPSRTLSPLEQMFARAEETGKPQGAKRNTFKQAGPPPLKRATPPSEARTPGEPATPAADDLAVTIEPKPRQWRELDTVPDRLFDRVGNR